MPNQQGVEYFSMTFTIEVFRAQYFEGLIEGLVFQQNTTKDRHFSFEVLRRQSMGWCLNHAHLPAR